MTQITHRGFGLVEILVAMLLLAIVGVSLVVFSARSARETGDARMRAEAVALADQKLAELQTMTGDIAFNQLANNDDTTAVANHIRGTTTEFVRTWRVKADSNIAKRATVDVTWRSSTGEERTQAHGMIYLESNAIRHLGVPTGATPCTPGHPGAMQTNKGTACGNASPMGMGH